jgi:UPF0716 protein FxsA
MNGAKWLLIVLLALPLAELAALIAVIVAIGLFWAVAMQAASSLVGVMVLRHAGGTHISRVRTAMNQARVTALQAEGAGSLTLLAGILMLVPGFITDLAGLILLIGTTLRGAPPRRADDGVVDLAPEQWHHIEDAKVTDRRGDDRKA